MSADGKFTFRFILYSKRTRESCGRGREVGNSSQRDFRPRHVVAFFDKALYDVFAELVSSNKQKSNRKEVKSIQPEIMSIGKV